MNSAASIDAKLVPSTQLNGFFAQALTKQLSVTFWQVFTAFNAAKDAPSSINCLNLESPWGANLPASATEPNNSFLPSFWQRCNVESQSKACFLNNLFVVHNSKSAPQISSRCKQFV